MKNFLLTSIVLALSFTSASAQCDPSTYTEPQFEISVQNPGCPQQSEIRVTTATGGTGPYQYTLLPANISNSTGIFTNVAAGTYFVQLKDACGTIRTRQATLTPYVFTTTSTLTSTGCGNFQFDISCSVNDPTLEYGYSIDGGRNIIWSSSSVIQLALAAGSQILLYVKDHCGNQAESGHLIAKELGGYIKILNERIECFEQEIYPEYYGFESPKVCLYKSPQNTLVECKQAPAGGYSGGAETNFFDLPFGQDWYVIVEDGCYRDSMFFKDKTSAGGSEVNPFAWHCNGFDMHVDGNNADTVCLYNAITNQLVSCQNATTGINPNTGQPWPYSGAEWYNLPYGTYYAYLFDPCANMVVRIDSTIAYPRTFSADLHKVCRVYETVISSYFGPESPLPHSTTVFYPNGSIAATLTSTSYLPKYDVYYPTWPAAGTITVIQTDGCGRADTNTYFQPMQLPERTIEFRGGCPGVTGVSGGGDLILRGDRYSYGGKENSAGIARVTIIRKDNNIVNIPATHTQWNFITEQQEYRFTNLSSGIYIIESKIGCNDYTVYDTAIVRPYIYPTQDQPHIYQCGSNAYVFRDSVTGGVRPFTYEILATSPLLSSLLTGPQGSNTFHIPPGTSLSTITVRVVDACGNSNIKMFPVNHLGSCDPLVGINPVQNRLLSSKPINIYPNPSTGDFVIEIAQRQKQDYRIEIFNNATALMYAQVIKNVDRKTIPIHKPMERGVYLVVVTSLQNGKKSIHKQVVL